MSIKVANNILTSLHLRSDKKGIKNAANSEMNKHVKTKGSRYSEKPRGLTSLSLDSVCIILVDGS